MFLAFLEAGFLGASFHFGTDNRVIKCIAWIKRAMGPDLFGNSGCIFANGQSDSGFGRAVFNSGLDDLPLF